MAEVAGVTGKVMVVDDQKLVRRSLGRLLRRAGHDVIFAADGLEAIDVYMATDPRPDLILLDMDMPELDGAGVFTRLQELTPDVRVIFVSGYLEQGREKRLLDLGAIALVNKPYDTTDLLSLVSETIARGRAEP
jgi:CheY-like chemotaxis protein